MSELSDMGIVLNEDFEVPLRQRIAALERLMLDAWRRGYRAGRKPDPETAWTPGELVQIALQSGIEVRRA